MEMVSVRAVAWWSQLVWVGVGALTFGCSTLDSKANLIDSDGDGSPDVRDCEPDNPDIAPGTDEICDGIDQDCDGEIDENAVDATEEVCDGLDNDCDGEVDEDLQVAYYPDEDGDGFGDGSLPTWSCEPVAGFLEDGSDCDDTNPDIHPDRAETCDGIDYNCNSEVDEGLLSTFYADTDGDGFGDAENTAELCEATEGFLSEATDCDDSDGTVYPGAPESCNDGIDQDCDSEDTYCLIYGDLELSADADITFYGLANESGTGGTVGFAGDVNGDGRQEVFVASTTFQNGNSTQADVGRVDVVTLDSGFDRGVVDLSAASGTGWDSTGIIGTDRNGKMGTQATGVGDVDGDGLDDFIVSHTSIAAYYVSGGAAYLVLGSSMGNGNILAGSGADFIFTPSRRDQLVGSAVYPAGDLNGDGFEDILVGGKGSVYSTAGKPGALMVWLGCESGIGACNDSDGDGVYESTHAWGDRATVNEADSSLEGAEGSTDAVGSAIAARFDFNGDGAGDVLIGAEGASGGAGEAYLVIDYPFSSVEARSQAEIVLIGETSGDGVGSVLSAPGDLDGDGYDDLIIGAPDADASTGAIYLFLGRDNVELSLLDRETGLADVDIKLVGEDPGERFGDAVAPSGDIDGDGIVELMVGASKASPGGVTEAGEVRILRGPPAADMADDPLARISGTAESGQVGASVAGGVDLNGDGWTEIMVGAPRFDGSGSAFLLFGGYHP